ncbi:MATE family efflux transporter [soil metagenome]
MTPADLQAAASPAQRHVRSGWLDSARRIAPLAWPVFIGQVAVLAFATVDTVMVARYSALDLAALAIGGAAYVSIFVGLMGVVLAIGPIAGQLFGAGRLHECGRQLHQALWLALALSVPGCALLAFPEPFLSLAQAGPEVSAKVRDFMATLAWALPPALLFSAFRGFSVAVSRPKAVMALQLLALALKVPLTALFVFGTDASTLGDFGMPALGARGCALATATVMILQVAAAGLLLRRDPFYASFGLHGRIAMPDRASLVALLRLGVPIGLSLAIEVTGFTFMAFFISRVGATAVAGHQIAVNLVSMMYMMPLAIGSAAGTLVAQRIGADDAADARRIGWHSLQWGAAISATLGGIGYRLREPILRFYTHDATVIAAAVPLLAWVAVFHFADAVQTVASFVLRAYRIATVPMVIYAIALWGVGLGGGYLIAFDTIGRSPASLLGAQGFWSSATAGLVVSALAMTVYMAITLRRQRAMSR